MAIGRRVAWRRLDVEGVGVARLDSYGDDDDGLQIYADEVVIAGRRSHATRIDIDADIGIDGRWLTRFAWIHVIGPVPWRSLQLERAGPDTWRVNGRRSRRLDGCVELDVAATPLTNTFAIRNLGLQIGEERTISVAWVDVPSLRLSVEAQSYARIGPTRDHPGLEAWEFATAAGRRYRLTVDPDGLVSDYEGFATRVDGDALVRQRQRWQPTSR